MAEMQRKYTSPLREQQAGVTRERILEATKKLLAESGYAKTTIDAIAREAVVSPQTVYAAFKNKRNIISALIHKNLETELDDLYKKTVQLEDVRARLEGFEEITLKCHVKISAENSLLRNAGILSPELARIQKDCEARGREIQRGYNQALLKGVKLKKGLTLDKALDIFWYIIKYEAYSAFVLECGWTEAEYKGWLCESLGALLDEKGVG